MLSLALLAVLSASDKPVVSVLYFESQSKDEELGYVGKGLADMLITDLVAWEGVRVVERTRVEEVLKELNFQQTKFVDKKTAAKLGQVLNADYLVVGSLVPGGERLSVEARLLQVSNGETLIAAREQDSKDKIFDIEQRLANQLVAKIDDKLTANSNARRKAKVNDLATVMAYGKALDLTDKGQLEEAQAAMRALVSKSPTFLLARERQTELLKKLEDYQKRKKDMIAGSALELGKLIDKTLSDEARFSSLTKEQQEHFLTMRVLKGKFLARVLKQFLSNRDGTTRVARKGEEGRALVAMRDWYENQRRYVQEYERASRQFATVANGVSYPASLNDKLAEDEERLKTESQFGDLRVGDGGFEALARFVFTGWLDDGDSYRAYPVLAAADPKIEKAVRDEIEAKVADAVKRAAAGDKRASNEAVRLMELLADVAVRKGDIDAAVVAYQRILDNFPFDSRATWVENRIKALLEGRGNEFNDLNRWGDALRDCKDMDIRVGMQVVDRRMALSGLKAIDEVAAELEKACKVVKANQSAFAYTYNNLALKAARSDDCDRYRAYTRKYLEADGSVADMLGYNKNHVPWCTLDDVGKDLVWLKATLDRHWSLEFVRHLVSQKSNDGKVFFISGNTDGPKIPGGSEESLDLRLERGKDGAFTCVLGRWRRSDGDYVEGTCKVNVTKWAPDDGPGFDEGTFEITFPQVKQPNGLVTKVEISRGEFRTRRQ